MWLLEKKISVVDSYVIVYTHEVINTACIYNNYGSVLVPY